MNGYVMFTPGVVYYCQYNDKRYIGVLEKQDEKNVTIKLANTEGFAFEYRTFKRSKLLAEVIR